jgi:hypothetical protein
MLLTAAVQPGIGVAAGCLLTPIAGTGRVEPCLGSDEGPDIQLNSTGIVTDKVDYRGVTNNA